MKKLYYFILLSLFLSTNSFSQSSDLIFLKCTTESEYRDGKKIEKNTFLEHYFTINKKEGFLYYEAYKDVKGKIEKLNRKKIMLQPSPYEEDNKIYLTFGLVYFQFDKRDKQHIYYDLYRFNILDIERNERGKIFKEHNLIIDFDGKSSTTSSISNCVREKNKFN